MMHGWTVAYPGRIALTLVNQEVGGRKTYNFFFSAGKKKSRA
jgi:hypothetical protein